MHFANLVRNARIEQHAFSRRGFTRVDVRHDADITVSIDRCISCHYSYSFKSTMLKNKPAPEPAGAGHYKA
jgi:hypothetical protein